MEIRFSKYNAPFCEPSEPHVHYISLDDQRLMAMGLYSAHVHAYRQLPQSRVIEVFDYLNGTNHIFDISDTHYMPPYASLPAPVLTLDELTFLDELHYSSGIKAAAKGSGRDAFQFKNKQKARDRLDKKAAEKRRASK